MTTPSLLSQRFKVLKLPNFISPRLMMYLGVFVVVLAIIAVSYKVAEAQPNQLIINADNLSAREYAVLQSNTTGYDINSFFSTSLPEIQREIKKLDWVNQVNIERKWREGIEITVLPRRAVARFGSNHLIDAEGQVFKPVDTQDLFEEDLVMLHSEADQSFLIMQQMQQVNKWFLPLNMSVKDMVLTPRMTWIIKFEDNVSDDGIRVVVDNEQTAQKLKQLSLLLQNQLADKREDIASLDLRYKNGFVIEWKTTVIQNNKVMAQSQVDMDMQ